MTKRHFESFARDIAASDNDRPTKIFAALVVIRTAETFNPRFNRRRFLVACGLADNE